MVHPVQYEMQLQYHSRSNLYVCCKRADCRNGRREPVTIQCTRVHTTGKYYWLIWRVQPFFIDSCHSWPFIFSWSNKSSAVAEMAPWNVAQVKQLMKRWKWVSLLEKNIWPKPIYVHSQKWYNAKKLVSFCYIFVTDTMGLALWLQSVQCSWLRKLPLCEKWHKTKAITPSNVTTCSVTCIIIHLYLKRMYKHHQGDEGCSRPTRAKTR